MTPALVAWLKRARLIGMAIALLSRIALSTKRRDDMTEQNRNEQNRNRQNRQNQNRENEPKRQNENRENEENQREEE